MSVHASLATILATQLAAAPIPASFTPPSEIPSDALLVVGIEKPNQLLSELETLAVGAGLAPPGAKAGWLKAKLAEEQPYMNDLDLDAPIWVAGRKEGKGRPPVLLVAKLSNEGKALVTHLKSQGLTAQVSDGRLIARTDKAKDWKSKQSFAFAPSTRELRNRSRIVMHVDPRLLEGQGPSELRQLQDPSTFGLGLSIAGVEILLQSQPNPKSPMAKLVAATPNTTEALITGLPTANYAMLFGGRSHPNTVAAAVDWLKGPMKAMADEADVPPSVWKLLESMKEISPAKAGCEASAVGVGIPSGPESAFFASTRQCKAPKLADEGLQRFARTLEKTMKAETKGKDKPSIAAVEPKKVGSAKLSGLRLVPPKSEADKVPPLVAVPLLYGAVTKAATVLDWNLPEALLTKHVEAAQKGSSPNLTSFAAAQKHLLSPRVTEGYINLGAIAGPLLPPDMAPMRFILGTIPAVGFATQNHPDGSTLMQVWLPKEVAQLAGMAAQMAQGGR